MESIRDLDLSTLQSRARARLDPVRGVVLGQGGLTRLVREVLLTWRCGTLQTPISWVREELLHGMAVLFATGRAASPFDPALAVVRGLMIARAHPTHGPFTDLPLAGVEGLGAKLEELYAAAPAAWDAQALQHLLLEGAQRFSGMLALDPEDVWFRDASCPHLRALGICLLLDGFGALDPAFVRQDALAGEWWLVQPTSPRLDLSVLARRLRLRCVGLMPAAQLDVPDRMVMMCLPVDDVADQQRVAELDDSKWVQGWRKVVWDRRRGPLADATFEIVSLPPSGSYLHSSELPPWP